MSLTDQAREFLQQMRALGQDDEGREVFVGLTSDESTEYLRLLFLPEAERSSDDDERELELGDKHELVRQQIIAAEAEARRAGPRH